MKHYLVGLNLQNKTCLVVGAGTVATRKVRGLLDACATISVVSPDLSDTLAKLVDDSQINWIPESYSGKILNEIKPFLVVAATDNHDVNRQITVDARTIGAIVNNVSAPEESDFHNLATIEQGNVQVGISSGASSPTLMRYLREEFEHVVDNAIGILSQWLGNLRPLVTDSLAIQSDRQALYREIIASDVLSLLRDGQLENAQKLFDAIVQEHLS